MLIILFKNRPIVPDATLDQVDPLVTFLQIHIAQNFTEKYLFTEFENIDRKFYFSGAIWRNIRYPKVRIRNKSVHFSYI